MQLHAIAALGSCAAGQIIVADFDGDGRSDIAMTGCGAMSGVTVLRQQPGGGYIAETATTADTDWQLAATDIDGDGRAELVIVSSFRQFSFLRRDAAGSWSTASTLDAAANFVSGWRLADLNGDGRPDLVWVRDDGGQRRQLRTGVDAAHRRRIRHGPQPAARHLRGGCAGAGRRRRQRRRPPDVVLTSRNNEGASRLTVLHQDGSGGFVASATTLPVDFNAASATIGDVDGDGRSDIVVTHSTSRQHRRRAAGGRRQPAARAAVRVGLRRLRIPGRGALLDLDADGRTDIVVGSDVLSGRPVNGAWPLQAVDRARAAAAAPAPASAPATARSDAAAALRTLRILRSAASATGAAARR